MNIPTKALQDKRSKGLKRPVTTISKLSRVGPRNRNTGASIRGRQHGGGFPASQA